VVPWLFGHTPCRRLIAEIPAYNRLTVQLARRSGFIDYGRNPKSFMKFGKLQDLVLMGLSEV
jgi:L-amino acid N-acyltransferase YncA